MTKTKSTITDAEPEVPQTDVEPEREPEPVCGGYPEAFAGEPPDEGEKSDGAPHWLLMTIRDMGQVMVPVTEESVDLFLDNLNMQGYISVQNVHTHDEFYFATSNETPLGTVQHITPSSYARMVEESAKARLEAEAELERANTQARLGMPNRAAVRGNNRHIVTGR